MCIRKLRYDINRYPMIKQRQDRASGSGQAIVECGMAAVDHGADAVYIGAPRFGARAAAGNSVEDIARVGGSMPIRIPCRSLCHGQYHPEGRRTDGDGED